jgi:DNA-binding MarR family transcriptional regulator
MPGMEGQRPIGWWVKRLDALLEQAVDSAVVGEGLARRHWQVLHSLAADARRESELRATLADLPGDVGVVVTELVERGWAERPAGDSVALTAEGRAAHDRVAAEVGRVRRRLADGLSHQEHERTIIVLSRMVENLERALGQDGGQPRR